MTNDPVFTQIIWAVALASQPSLSHFYTRFDHESIEHLHHANQEILDKVPAFRGSKALLVDSGFAVPALYDLCERESVYYVIRLKSNTVLQQEGRA